MGVGKLVEIKETSKSSLFMVFGNPVTLIVSRFLSTGDKLFGVNRVTLVGAVETETDFELSTFPLTLTVSVIVVEVEISNAEVMHLINVEEIDTISHLELSLKTSDMIFPSFND